MPSPLPVTVVVLGPDRVGKSTLVENTHEMLRSKDIDVRKLHFSGPLPHDNSPIDQYTRPFNLELEARPEVILCDRGFSEVCFYERFRRRVEISHEWAQSAESYFSSRSRSIHVFLIDRAWGWAQPFHVKEIEEQYPDSTPYFRSKQLEVRRLEHNEYYKHMDEYLSKYSLLPHKRITPLTKLESLHELVVGDLT